METDSLRLLKQRQSELTAHLETLRASIKPIELELEQVNIGIRAMQGDLVLSTGAKASLSSVAHYARKSNPDMQTLTMKQLIVKALGEHLASGATANELLDYFSREWGRNEIMRTSLSPQLSRLKQDGIIELRGKVWHLVRKENGALNGSPDAKKVTAGNDDLFKSSLQSGASEPGKE